MMRRLAVVAVLVAGMVLAGCGSSAADSPPANVKPMLLSLSEMPAGWLVWKPGNAGGGKNCLVGRYHPHRTLVSRGSVSYTAGTNGPIVSEVLVSYRGPLAGVFSYLVERMSRCHISEPSGVGSFRIRYTRMASPRLGNQSAAFYVPWLLRPGKAAGGCSWCAKDRFCWLLRSSVSEVRALPSSSTSPSWRSPMCGNSHRVDAGGLGGAVPLALEPRGRALGGRRVNPPQRRAPGTFYVRQGLPQPRAGQTSDARLPAALQRIARSKAVSLQRLL